MPDNYFHEFVLYLKVGVGNKDKLLHHGMQQRCDLYFVA